MSDDATIDQSVVSAQHGRELSKRDQAPELPGYTLQHILGEGTFGAVWSATQLSTGQAVAVKLLTRTEGLNLSLFASELDRLTEVAEHPHIVTVLDANLAHSPPYIVMSWVRGGNLSQRSPAAPAQVRGWLEQMAQALLFTHEKGIIHCDLKPSNILLDERDSVRVADFGQSRATTREEGVLGTLGFMPPEQTLAGTEVPGSTPNVRWDVYALGATVYWLMQGHCPRLSGQYGTVGSTLSERLESYRECLQTGVLVRPSGIDRDLWDLLQAMLELDPRRRTASMADVLEDLDRSRRGEPLLARRPWSLNYRVGRWMRKPVVAISLLALLLAGGTAVHSYGRVVAEKRRADGLLLQARVDRAVAADEAGDHVLGALWWEQARAGRPDDAELRLQFCSYPLVRTGPVPAFVPRPPRSEHGLDPNYGGLSVEAGGRVAERCSDTINFWARVYDKRTGRPLGPRIPQPSFFESMELSPTGAYLALAADPYYRQSGAAISGRVVEVVQTADGSQQTNPLLHSDEVRALAFHPGKDELACGCADGSVTVWGLATGQVVAGGLRTGSPVLDLQYTPDGRYLLALCADGKTRAWDAVARQPALRKMAEGPVLQAAWRPDGSLVVATVDGWSLMRPPGFLAERHPQKLGYAYVLSARGGYLAQVEPGRLLCRSTTTGMETKIELPAEVSNLRFARDEAWLGALCSDGTFLRLDLKAGKAFTRKLPVQAEKASFDLSADGSQLLVSDGQTRLFDLKSGSLLRSWPGEREACALGPDGRVAVGDESGQVHQATGGAALDLPVPQDHKEEADRRVYDLRFAGEHLISTSMDGEISVFGSANRLYPGFKFPNATSVSVDVLGDQLAAASSEGLVRFWSLRDGRPITPLLQVPESLAGVQLSPSGDWLCVCSSTTASLLSLRNKPVDVASATGMRLNPVTATVEPLRR